MPVAGSPARHFLPTGQATIVSIGSCPGVLRERVAAIEAHVGLGDAGGEVVADD